MSNTQRILLVDDEQNLLDVLQAYFEKEGFLVNRAADGQTGINLFRSWQPQLVVLDLMLPNLSGEEVCQIIRRESNIPILMLTAKTGKEDIVTGLDLGADDYVTKPFSPKEVLARSRALLRRAIGDSKPLLAEKLVFDQGRLVVDISRQEAMRNGQPIALTRAEFRLLLTLCRYPGRIFSRAELLDRVMGEEFNGYDRTIDAHIKNLRQKIEDDPKTPRWILTAFGSGYKFWGEKA